MVKNILFLFMQLLDFYIYIYIMFYYWTFSQNQIK